MSETLDTLIQQATVDELVAALAKRGAHTRRLAGDKLKVSLTLPLNRPPAASPRQRRQTSRVSEIHPDARL